MAKRNSPMNTGNTVPHTFDKELEEDVSGIGLPNNVWTQARNATPNTTRGDLGELSNEQSNKFCLATPYPICGLIYIDGDRWVIMSTDNNNNHEIGLFVESTCTYTTIVNDPCLNFSILHLVFGVAKENHDCTWQIYFTSHGNPDRTLNIDNVPWIQNCVTDAFGCITCTDTAQLDCDAIRLAPLIDNPCFSVQKGPQGGELLNGSYFVVGAYVVNGQRVSDYSVPSNVQALFSHNNVAGSLEIIVENMDPNFDEFELVVVEIRSLKTLAKKIGVYSTRQQRISIDIIDDRYPTVDLNLIALRNPIVDSSDAIYRNGDYMLRVGPYDKFDFNYQPLANQINAEWVSVEYPADYYRKGGNKTNYLRDEVYSFFIRWVYDTGDKTVSYHIPGRAPLPIELLPVSTDALPDEIANGLNKKWRVENTATVTSLAQSTLPDGGVIRGRGKMAYWESSERYDDNTPEIWNASSNPIWGSVNPDHDLCNRNIRHHRFPDNTKGYDGAGSWVSNHYNGDGSKIRVMGIQFNNIKPPLNNDGTPITNVVGYEILRGTREGNKSIVAKGMINNMRRTLFAGNSTNRQGLYPNYPYNPVGTDKFIEWLPGVPNAQVSQNHFTFHSPDTSFRDPFLSAKELTLYGELVGKSEGKFEYPVGHPKHKLITDLTFFVALVGGVGYALIKKNGKLTTTKVEPRVLNMGDSQYGVFAGLTSGFHVGASPGFGAGSGMGPTVPIYPSVTQSTIVAGMTPGSTAQLLNKNAGGFIATALLGLGPATYFAALNTKINGGTISSTPGMMGGYTTETVDGGVDRQMPPIISLVNGALDFAIAVSEGGDTVLRLIRALSTSNQYALQYQSHCFYNLFGSDTPGNRRKVINEAIYLDPDLQDFGTNWRINNLYRSRTVALETGAIVGYTNSTDSTQVTVDDAINLFGLDSSKPTDLSFGTQAASHYVGLKQRLVNQYGQLEGIIQVPVTSCMTPITQTTSDVLFGGDTYIGRYTEKNTMFFWYNWLNGQPDYAELNYQDYQMVGYPKYYANFEEFDFNEFFGQIVNNLLSPGSWGGFLPSGRHNLDGSGGGFWIKNSEYFHLFNSGVRDFFVESEINIDFRDWGDADSERHYDPYGYSDLKSLFNTGIIKSGNYYKYDYSLSIARLYTNVTSWGNTHPRNYNPIVAQECLAYRPNRVIYSLQQNLENTKDYWRIFLPNNYKDFKSRITAIKPVNKNGAMILFENESPVEFKGVDVLQTDGGTKITLGDGGLFSQPLQNVLNTDESYEYGSCQNRLSVVNTASGIFWMSQNQGKIFQMQNGIKEISAFDNKWWLATYLPYMLTKDFIDFELTDNPVAGIGCQTIYDNEAQLIYFCKKDYFLRRDIADTVTYVSGDDFLVNGFLPIKLGDPAYFNDASWTISYDPKTDAWISYHDWHPDLVIPGKTNFLTVKKNGIWRHNDNCQSYCNYYGVDYPFEVEYASVTPNTVNTLRSIEYFMEAYKYADNCYDRFHVLDFNFDEAIIYNSEQCSGLLRLNLSPKNNAPEIVTYPRINPNFIDVLYNKVEQKYRFNQFWDITDNRGEFNAAAERMIFDTEPNGYIRNLNPNNLDYNKFQLERKKFRHFKNTVLLRRRVCGNRNMLVSIANNKNLISPR
jgi:hypothetical protein